MTGGGADLIALAQITGFSPRELLDMDLEDLAGWMEDAAEFAERRAAAERDAAGLG